MIKGLTFKVFSLANSENEPAIRDLVRYYTSYYVMRNAECEIFFLSSPSCLGLMSYAPQSSL